MRENLQKNREENPYILEGNVRSEEEKNLIVAFLNSVFVRLILKTVGQTSKSTIDLILVNNTHRTVVMF